MEKCRVFVDKKEMLLDNGITLEELAKALDTNDGNRIILAEVDGRLSELYKKVEDGTTVEFKNISSTNGYMAFCRSAFLIMLKAFKDVLGRGGEDKIEFRHVLGSSVYCECSDGTVFSEDVLGKVETRMRELIGLDLRIVKNHVTSDEVDRYFSPRRAKELKEMLRFRVHSHMNVYFLDDYADYFYGYMAPSTGYVKILGLEAYRDGFLLHLPSEENLKEGKGEEDTFIDRPKLFEILEQSKDWAKTMKVATVGDLNQCIAEGKMQNLILVQEALMEKRIGEIADEIAESGKKVVLIAGPSSSGKTSFSHRLSIQLSAHGLEPHPIAMDDYFVDHVNTPIDPKTGKYDFEALETVDIEVLNRDILALLDGKEVAMPTFNFLTGLREYKGNTLKLGGKGILVIEGIHGLNERATYKIPKEDKFKIYISAMTSINVDAHNSIAATDGRLLRRMTRDVVGRGASPEKTIGMWSSVRAGEEKNIFPYQEEADVMFNSSLVYEISILKQYAQPLLFQVDPNTPEGIQAKRLLKFLSYFVGTDSATVPNNSVLREFIGGSCFFK